MGLRHPAQLSEPLSWAGCPVSENCRHHGEAARRDVPLSDSPQQTRPPQTRSVSDSTFRIAPGARSSGRRTANVSPLAPMPTPATYAALQDTVVPYMALSCAWRRRIHVGVAGSRGVLAY